MHDSVEEDEYMETINKLGANVRCLEQAEGKLYTAHATPRADKSRILCSSAIAEPVDVRYACLLEHYPTRVSCSNWAKGALERL